jgi:hypothetical protein
MRAKLNKQLDRMTDEGIQKPVITYKRKECGDRKP